MGEKSDSDDKYISWNSVNVIFRMKWSFSYVQCFLFILKGCKAFKKKSSDYIINDVVFIDDI